MKRSARSPASRVKSAELRPSHFGQKACALFNYSGLRNHQHSLSSVSGMISSYSDFFFFYIFQSINNNTRAVVFFFCASITLKLEAASIRQPADPLSFAPPCREIQYVSFLMNLGYQPLPPPTPPLLHVRERPSNRPPPPLSLIVKNKESYRKEKLHTCAK